MYSIEKKPNPSIKDVILEMEKHHDVPFSEYIYKIYDFACEKHGDQVRRSGEPYIMHPLRVALFAASWGLETDAIGAALLHDTVEDCKDVTIETIEKEFNKGIADYVRCLTAIDSFMPKEEKEQYTKEELDELDDEYLVKNMSRTALLIKIADRLDNLETIDCFELEKRIAKVQHTRKVLIPFAKRSKAFCLAEKLEDHCLKVENPDRYFGISNRYNRIYDENAYSITVFRNKCSEIFEGITKLKDNSLTNQLSNEPEIMQLLNSIREFNVTRRSISSLNRQIIRNDSKYDSSFTKSITKSNTPLLDISIAIDDVYLKDNQVESIFDIFYVVYDRFLMPQGITIINNSVSSYDNSPYIIVRDLMNNLYRVFVKSRTDYFRFLIGDIVDNMGSFDITDIEKVDPDRKQIKVYKRDGSEMMIDKGATVLDFAFAIHTEIGKHFECAEIDGVGKELSMKHVLNEGDRVIIHTSAKIYPSFRWFNFVRTPYAISKLASLLSPSKKMKIHLMGSSTTIDIEKGSTVLDLAFAIDPLTGMHFDYATINGEGVKLGPNTELSEKNRYTIHTSKEVEPTIEWFKFAKTDEATDNLVHFFMDNKS